MDAYEVIITPDAEYDLNELDDYIINRPQFPFNQLHQLSGPPSDSL